MNEIIKILDEIKTSVVKNYVIAGLDSHLVMNGKVRVFRCSRNHQDSITPHSHRFDFACMVLAGTVTNRIWNGCSKFQPDGDEFKVSIIDYSGNIGEHTVTESVSQHFTYADTVYSVGEVYNMKHSDIHSIQFSKDAVVLFFEGVDKTNKSVIIEPVVNGTVISTYKKEDYMFLTEENL